MRNIIGLSTFFVFAGCTATLEVPPGTQVACSSDADCFNGQRCQLDTRLCVDATQACVIDTGSGFSQVANGTSCTQKNGASGVCLGGQCLTSTCGDGFRDPATAEQCDNGAANSNTVPNACRSDCRDARCGDGVVDTGKEVCDDGNTASGDGCRADCKKVEVCGDAELDAGETCDDANSNPNDGCDQCAATTWGATLVLGRGDAGGALSTMTMASAGPMAADLRGRLYFADITCRLFMIDATLTAVTVIAGSGVCGSQPGNGAIAHGTDIAGVTAIAVDADGAVHFADGTYIRRIDPLTGRMSVIAGNGGVCISAGQCPGGQSALVTPIRDVRGMAFDPNGNLFYSQGFAHDVRAIFVGNPNQYVMIGTTFTSGSTFTEGDPGSSVLLNEPGGLATDANGRLYLTDFGNKRILRYDVNADATSLIAGTGASTSSPDGSVAVTSPIAFASNVALDLGRRRTGEIVFTESGKIRVIGIDGLLGTIGGTGITGSTGTGGPATAAKLSATHFALFDRGGMAFSEGFGTIGSLIKIRSISAAGIIDDEAKSLPSGGLNLGQASTATQLKNMMSFEVAPNGDVFISYSGPAMILRADAATGDTTLYAGGGTQSTGTVAATDALFSVPTAMRVRPNGDLIVVDSYNHQVKKIDAATHMVSTIAGTGVTGFFGDGAAATSAKLAMPCDVDFATNGDMYIWDCGNARIRKVDHLTGFISTVVGNGTPCASGASACGDSPPGAPLSAQLGSNDPQSKRAVLRIAANDDIYFSDPALNRVRMVSVAGNTIQTIAGSGAGPGGAGCTTASDACGDGGQATSAVLGGLGGIAFDGGGLVLTTSNRVRRMNGLTGTAIISAFAVQANPGASNVFSGDGGPPLGAHGLAGSYVTRTSDGAIYFNNFSLVRKVANGVITTVAGLVDSIGDGPAVRGELGHPHALTALSDTQWLVADGDQGRVRLFDETAQRLSSVVGYKAGFTEAVLPGGLARYLQQLGDAAGVAYDAVGGKLYVAEAGRNTIRAVTVSGAPSAWTVATYAGDVNGQPDWGDGAVASARFTAPRGIALDATRNALWVADSGNHVIRRIDLGANTVSTLGGQPHLHGYAGDRGAVGDAYFDGPSSIAVDPVDGSLYVTDTNNNRVRRIAADGSGAIDATSIIDTVLGDGSPSGSGSGKPARAFAAERPDGVTFDSFGDLWVSTGSSVRIVTAGADGVPTGDDTVLTVYGTPPRDTFPESATTCLAGLTVRRGDASVYVLDGCLGFMVRLDRTKLP